LSVEAKEGLRAGDVSSMTANSAVGTARKVLTIVALGGLLAVSCGSASTSVETSLGADADDQQAQQGQQDLQQDQQDRQSTTTGPPNTVEPVPLQDCESLAPATTRLPLFNETDLVIFGGTFDFIEEQVQEYNGEIVQGFDGVVTGVRFPVDCLAQLLVIKEELESRSFTVQLNYAEDEPIPDLDPVETPPTTRLPLANETDLLFLAFNQEALEERIGEYDGEIIDGRDGSFALVRFPVDSLSELLVIQEAIAESGLDSQLNYADVEPASSPSEGS